jgi:hypothetical protein
MMDWGAFEELVKLTIIRLQQGRGNATKVRAAIRHYISRGDAFGMSPMILTDYFAISRPGIPRQAGFTDDEVEGAVAVFEDLMDAKFGTSG